MQPAEYLDSVEANYDAKVHMPGLENKSPGYHTTIPNGVWVHPTRDALDYALILLQEGSASRVRRACEIIRKVISLQDRDPVSPTYGIWSWYLEEPLAQMSPPDWNWADFCGLRLGWIYRDYGKRLPAPLLRQVAASLDHAALSIVRRNMGAHYTNIAIMGGIVTAVAGEILGEKRWLHYGRRRLEQSVEHFRFHGGFNEYNSPTYTMTVLRDCEHGLQLLKQKEVIRPLKFLWRAAWVTIAEHFHPPTGQWAGPQSRSYHTFLHPEPAFRLEERTNTPIPVHPQLQGAAPAQGFLKDVHAVPCPSDLRPRFRSLPGAPYEIKRRFIRRSADESSICGTTWFSKTACVGSVNHDALWDQSRGLLAYWIGAGNNPVALRLRFLHDGREFASAYAVNRQDGPRVLSALHLLLDRGDFHPMFDPPKDNIFQAGDFRLRYEFVGPGLSIETLPDGRFAVSSGSCQAIITTAPCIFGNSSARWQPELTDGRAHIDAILYHGKPRAFDFKTLSPVRIAAGFQLVDAASRPKPSLMKWRRSANGSAIHWPGRPSLDAKIPDRAVPFSDKNG